MVIWVMHTQELYEPFIVSCFFNEKKLGRDSKWRFLLGKKLLTTYVYQTVLQEVEEFPFN